MGVKRKQIGFSERHQEMLDELMKETGAVTETEIIRTALVHYHKSTFQSYTAIKKKQLDTKSSRTPSVVAEERRVGKEQAKRDSEEYGQTICEALEGKEYKEGANMICQWKTYDMVNKKHVIIGELEVPFEHLNEQHIEDQYQNGTKEQIVQAIADGAETE